MLFFMKTYPYAEISTLNWTLPFTAETPTMSKVMVEVFGVKMTLKRLAVKLEFA